jgi:hypothetical protein
VAAAVAAVVVAAVAVAEVAAVANLHAGDQRRRSVRRRFPLQRGVAIKAVVGGERFELPTLSV